MHSQLQWRTISLLGEVVFRKPVDLQRGAFRTLCRPMMSFSPDVSKCAPVCLSVLWGQAT